MTGKKKREEVTGEEASSPPWAECLAARGPLQALGNGSHVDLVLLFPLCRPLTIVQNPNIKLGLPFYS